MASPSKTSTWIWPFVVNLDGQTFTLPIKSFKAGKNKFTCSKIPVAEGNGIASASFDLKKCAFTLTIKNTSIGTDSGPANLNINFAGFSESAEVILP